MNRTHRGPPAPCSARSARRSLGALCALALLTGLPACQTPRAIADRDAILAEVRENQGITPVEEPSLDLADGLDESEAIECALVHEADFQAALATLGLHAAELRRAQWFENPVLSLLFPVGPKQLEFAVKAPLDWLWARPRRIELAALAGERAESLLVERGLSLIHRVRTLWVEIDRLERQLTVTRALLSIDQLRLEDLRTAERLGAASLQELDRERVDHGKRIAERIALERDLALARAEVRSICHVAPSIELVPLSPAGASAPPPSLDLCLVAAEASRPEVRAAELWVEQACVKSGLDRWRFIQLTGIADANAKGSNGFEIGPGVEFAIPVFDWGQFDRAAATVEVTKAELDLRTVLDRVRLEVEQAHVRCLAAESAAAEWQQRVLAPLERGLTGMRTEYSLGNTDRLTVLSAERELQLGIVTERKLAGDLRTTRLDLEKAIGCRLDHFPSLSTDAEGSP